MDQQHSVPNILLRLADQLGTSVVNNRLDIPAQYGTGYCEGYVFSEHLRLLISNYELKEDVLIDNPDVHNYGTMIFFKFQHIFPAATGIPSVLIATSSLNTDEVVTIHSNTATINIEADANYLKLLFKLTKNSPVLQNLLGNTQPLLFEQLILPSLQQVVNEILTEPFNATFQLFFLSIKAQELICRLLMELEKRNEKQLYPLNGQDIQIVYKVRDRMLSELGTPPSIASLATDAGMSPTKLKRLFGQIFGDSIFNYYQKFRMKEAARLLKEDDLSVSDVGYRMGFTNLSHFTRVFEEHIGIKPKKYQAMQKR